MANGEALDDEKYTVASWDYPFGSVLMITNIDNGRSVMVRVTDRGPARRLYRRGRVVDLSKAAFKTIAELDEGVVPVKIEVIK